MGKRERVRRMKREGLHEIKNKYRIHAVKKRRKGLVLTAKKKRRALKAGASLSAIFLLLLGVFAVGSAFFGSVVPNVVPDDFITAYYELPDDGSKPTDHSALENIGYMNYRFKNQPGWFMEMHGTTSTPVGPQSVNTLKQYSNGVLIMADVTSSGMVKAGRQFCYVGDEVMWRELPKNSSYKANSYEDFMALTYNDTLKAHMTTAAFKKKNGLPGTEMTVYVINEDTLDHASEVERVSVPFAASYADGTESFVEGPVYKQTYYLRPGNSENLGAAAHYANQMAFTGGLTGLPEFNYITVTYTFDSSWQVLRAEVSESYKATMGITVTCSSSFTSDYEYKTEKSYNPDYENFFKDFVGKGIDDDVEKPLDALGCITSAFLTEPVTFALDLEADGKKTDGLISLDASKLDIAKIMDSGSVDIGAALGCIGLKAKIGDIYIYLEDSAAYLAAGGLKAKLPVDDLLGLIAGEAQAQTADGGTADESQNGSQNESADEEAGAEVFALGDPVLSEKNGVSYASVQATLDLSSLGVNLKAPLDFLFKLDGEQNASLETLDLSLSYEGIEAKIGIKATDESLPELENRDSYIDLYPYAEAVYSLVSGKRLEIGLGYHNESIALTGSVGLDFTDGLLIAGELNLSVGKSAKTVLFTVKEGVAYLNLDGIKISASLSDALSLVEGFLPAGGDSAELKNTVDTVLSGIFDHDLLSLLSLTEEDDALTLGLKGTELLKAFGVDFALGDVSLTIGKGEIGASAYGADITVKALQKDLTPDTEGYSELAPYLETLIKLFTGDALTAKLNFEKKLSGKTLSLGGNVVIGLSPLSVSGELSVSYGALQRNIGLVYGDDHYLYLTLDALRIKANVNEAVSLISSLISTDEEEEADIYATLEKILGIDFGEILSLAETEDGLNAVVAGGKLFSLFGVDFDLGDVVLTVGEGKLSASALGVNISLASGGEVTTLSSDEKSAYADLKPVLDALPELLNKKALSFGGEVVLTTGDTDISVLLKRGVLSFADGVKAYLSLSLDTGSAALDLELSIDGERVRLALGNVGAEIEFSKLSSLGDKVMELYRELRESVNPIFEKELLPEAKTVKELLGLLTDLLPKSEGEEKGIDSVLGGLSIENSKEKGGLLAIKLMGVTLDLVNEADGFVGANVAFANDSLAVSGSLSTAVCDGTMPEMPEIGYLNADDFKEALDYLVAAVNTLTSENITVGFGVDMPKETADKKEVVNTLAGSAEYVRGGEHAFKVYDTETKKSVVVSPELYLHVTLSYADNAAGSNLYLELYVFNYKKDEADNTLDFFVTLTKYKEGDAGYNPLKLYASADEIMSVLSVAVSALGVDVDILDNYLVSRWLQPQTVADLRAVGSSIMSMLGVGSVKELFGGAKTASESAGSDFPIKSIGFAKPDENGVSTFALEWKSGKVTISKRGADDGKTYLTGVGLDLGGTEVAVTLDAQSKVKKAEVALDESYFKLEGIAKLLTLVATSATHSTTTVDNEGNPVYGSELNKIIYLNGQINLGITSSLLTNVTLTINVDSIAIIFEEDGVAVNVRFSYKAQVIRAVGVIDVTAINGDTTVNLTGKNGMVYIERTQTTDADGKGLAKPEVLYRAMPLKNFVGDLINQVGFLFNLGDTITSALASIGGSDGSGSSLINDFGDISDLLSCVYAEKADGTRDYTLVLHGEKLLSGTAKLSDVTVSVGTIKTKENEEVVRSLGISTKLEAANIITLDVKDTVLTYRNPRGIVDADIESTYKSTWHDVAQDLREGMQHRLEELEASKWEGVTFIEGQLTYLSYVLKTPDGEKELREPQKIVVATGNAGNAGDAKGTIYADFSINSYPSLEGYDNLLGFTPQWTKIYTQNDPLPDDMKVTATYVANEYKDLTIVSDYEIEGFEKVGDVWEKNYSVYAYGDALPAAENEIRRTAGFVDENGNPVSASDILSDGMKLYVQWELVEYKIYASVDGVETEATVHYGDLLENVLPVPEKEGYTFSHWSYTAGGDAVTTVTGTADYYAVFTPNVYKIVLKSEYALEGFAAGGDGYYYKTVEYVYGTQSELPTGEFETTVEGANKAMFLDGFKEGEGETLVTLAGIARNTTLTAVWSEVKHKVQYLADGKVITAQNYEDGDILVLPAAPEKFGYTAAWNLNGGEIAEGLRVHGDLEIVAEYTAIEYGFKIVSKHRPVDGGFIEQDGVWSKTYSYTYDREAVALGELQEVLGYYFGGFYTREEGGTRVEELSNQLVLNGNFTLYANWIDSTVNVRLYSNVDYDGSKLEMGGEYDGYYYTDKAYDNIMGYALDATAVKKGYTLLGWWAEVDGSYVHVSDVKQFREKGSVAVFAVWTQEIEITISDIVKGGTLNAQYKITGTVTGSEIYKKDDAAKQVYKKINVTSDAKAYFEVYGKKSTHDNVLKDNLNSGDPITIGQGGTYDTGFCNFGNGLNPSWGGLGYAGIRVEVTYSFDGRTVKMPEQKRILSYETYTVTFVTASGNQTVENVRVDCPFIDEYTTRVYADELAAEKGYVVPASSEEFYDNVWPHTVIEGTVTIEAVPAPKLCNVKITGVNAAGETAVSSAQVKYGQKILLSYRGETIKEYLIADHENEFDLTKDLPFGAYLLPINANENGFTIEAQSDPDSVILSSDVPFEYGGTKTQLTEAIKFDTEYTLPEISAEGYTFLGWFVNENGNWKKVEQITYTGGGKTATVEALWMKSSVTILSATRTNANWNSSKFKFHITASVDYEFVGAFASQIKLSTATVQFCVADDSSGKEGSKTSTFATVNVSDLSSVSGDSNGQITKQNRAYVKVNATFVCEEYGYSYTAFIDSDLLKWD